MHVILIVYHCYQREDATLRYKLPDRFMSELEEYVETAQIVYPFGGEPFFFSPVINFLRSQRQYRNTVLPDNKRDASDRQGV